MDSIANKSGLEACCGTCLFWSAKSESRGDCLRFPPMVVSHEGILVCTRPVVDDWELCGEWERKVS
jgi:hypothetical protein